MLDDIQDPGNMGSIIRTADWFGISNIICSPDSVEVYNPKVIQSTMGAFIRVAISYTPLKEVLASKPGIPATGAIMDGENIYETSLPGHGFIIIGNESHGISPGLATDLTKRISIPSSGTGTESLNASVATAVVLAEFYRQGIK